MNMPFEQVIRALLNELFLYRNYVVGTFVFFIVAGVGVGLVWPKMYTTSTIILVDNTNIIQPLMQGAAVATDVENQARIAREVIHGRRIMNQLYEYIEWLDEHPDEVNVIDPRESLDSNLASAEGSSNTTTALPGTPKAGSDKQIANVSMAATVDASNTNKSGASNNTSSDTVAMVSAGDSDPAPATASVNESETGAPALSAQSPASKSANPGESGKQDTLVSNTVTASPEGQSKTGPADMNQKKSSQADAGKGSEGTMAESGSDSATTGEIKPISPSALIEKEKKIEKLKERVRVTQVGRDTNVISISYSHPNAIIAYKAGQKLAHLFIDQSLEEKAEESRKAYEFINKQVAEYHTKLIGAEEQLKDFRISNLEARPGSEQQIDTRINEFRNRIERTELELREAQIRYSTLTSQLSGEAEATMTFTREGQHKQRIAELQTQLDTLRLTYHDTYPDIIRIKGQIEDLKKAIDEERVKREEQKKQSRGKLYVDEGVLANPLYQQLRTDLAQTRTMIATLEGRLLDARTQLAGELERAKKVHGGEAELAELTRDYQVNRDIYQDLLRRRENARVSMNLDRDKQGLTLKVQEPATMPLEPSGPRFLHFILGGILLGLLAPVSIIYGLQMVDPRVKFESILEEKMQLPVLATIPHLTSQVEVGAMERNFIHIGGILLFCGVAIVLVVGIKITGII